MRVKPRRESLRRNAALNMSGETRPRAICRAGHARSQLRAGYPLRSCKRNCRKLREPCPSSRESAACRVTPSVETRIKLYTDNAGSRRVVQVRLGKVVGPLSRERSPFIVHSAAILLPTRWLFARRARVVTLEERFAPITVENNRET